MRAPNLCIICKGSRALCGNRFCPLLAKFNIEPKIKNIKSKFFGKSYNSFVGRFGYPNINIGPLASAFEKPNIDNPTAWFGADYSKIVELRSMLIRSKLAENIFSKSRFVLENQELVLASKPTDVELYFKKKPFYRVSFSDVVQPMGPSAPLKKIRITENIKIGRKIEYIVEDNLKSVEQSFKLYNAGEDVYKISSILSAGILGKNKKLVPTRWGITAIDDIIAKKLINTMRTYKEINNYMVFESQYLDNHFVCLFMPGFWEFENFEAWSPGSLWTKNLKNIEILREYEGFYGRKKYAKLQGGGYYASRIAAVEKLINMKRQGKVIVFREIYEGYVVPLGVWVVRETARNAYKNKPEVFSTKQEALDYVNNRLRIPVQEYVKQSKILQQKKLVDFLR